MGMVRGPGEVDAQIRSESCVARAGQTASGPTARGHWAGTLDDLTNAIRKSGKAFKVE